MELISVYMTFGSKDEARRIIRILLEERLIACANLTKIESLYWWEGKIAGEGEWAAVSKTTYELWEKLQMRASQLHSYDIPCIIHKKIQATPAYKRWVIEAVSSLSSD